MAKIKICGICAPQDYEFITDLNVDFTGHIFYQKSKRYVQPSVVADMKSDIPKVGVFVNENIETVKETFYLAKLDLVQLHGDESPEYCKELGLPHWKAFSLEHTDNLSLINAYTNTETILIDSFKKGLRGGTGIRLERDLIREAIKYNKNIMIAGGIEIDNIESILEHTPFGVDINSGVELSPGKKDHAKCNDIVKLIRSKT